MGSSSFNEPSLSNNTASFLLHSAIVCISALEEKGWIKNDDGLWYDPQEELDLEGDK